jgi:hypothetical protein
MHVRVYAFVKHYYRGSNLLGIIEYGKDIFGEYFVEWLQSGCRKRSRKMKNAECSQSDIFFDPPPVCYHPLTCALVLYAHGTSGIFL